MKQRINLTSDGKLACTEPDCEKEFKTKEGFKYHLATLYTGEKFGQNRNTIHLETD